MSKDYNTGLDTAYAIVEEVIGGTEEGETILCGIESSKKTETENRTYYYDFGVSGQEPDYESMAAFLLDEGIVFLGCGTSCNHESAACLFININDYFVPAADGEDLPFSDIPKLFDMYRKYGYNGVAQYVADKRGIENKHWREK